MSSFFSKLFGGNSEEAEESKAPSRRTEVGWLLNDETSGLIWDDPKPVSWDHAKPTSAKSAQICPAVLQFDRLHYVINCPIDLHLKVNRSPQGELKITNADGPMSSVRPAGLQRMLVMSPQNEWRHPMRPMLQLVTPYVFLSDAPVYVNQFPPFLHYPKNAWPGVQVCGRFPIDVWPRVHMWALEWHDLSKDLILKRGEPLFYVRFETEDPSTQIRLIEAEKTAELESYMRQMLDVSNYVNQTFQLFKVAKERRPEKLLVPKTRS